MLRAGAVGGAVRGSDDASSGMRGLAGTSDGNKIQLVSIIMLAAWRYSHKVVHRFKDARVQ